MLHAQQCSDRMQRRSGLPTHPWHTHPTAWKAQEALFSPVRDARSAPALPRAPWPPAARSPQRWGLPWAAQRPPSAWAPARAHGRTSPALARPCAPWPPQWAGTCRSPTSRCVPQAPGAARAAAAATAAALRTARLQRAGACTAFKSLPPPPPPAGQAAERRARADDSAAAPWPGAPLRCPLICRSVCRCRPRPPTHRAHPPTPTQILLLLLFLPRCWVALGPTPAAAACSAHPTIATACHVQVETPDFADEVLECPSLRHLLRPRPSPFVVRCSC